MAYRMQQRRGTASQWTTADPILAAGEIGFETDTGEFRVGDGVNHWNDLSPFKNIVDLGGNLDDYIPLTLIGANDGVAPLSSTGQVPQIHLSDFETGIGNAISDLHSEISVEIFTSAQDTKQEINISTATAIAAAKQEAISDAATDATTKANTAQANAETTASGYVSDHAADETNVHGIADTAELATKTYTGSEIASHNATTLNVHGIADTSLLATKAYADDSASNAETAAATALSNHELDTTNIHGIADTAALATKTYADSAVSDAVAGLTKSSVGLANVDNTSDADKPISTATQTALDLKADLASPTFTGTVNAADITISGDLTVSGTTTTVNATDLVVADPLIYIGEGNSANLVDLGLVSSFNDGTYQHAGIVRDASEDKWKLFKGVTDEPTTTVNFTQGSLDNLAISALEASSATIGNVSNTELQYLNGVTSEIQTQLDSKLDSTTAASTYETIANVDLKAPKASPSFTGGVTVDSSGIIFTDGTQVKQGVPSLTTINQQTAGYTPVLADRDKLVEVSSASGVTVTIPADSSVAYPVGTSIDILQTGAGQVTIAGAGGVTVNATPGLKLRTQWSSATLFKRATDTWVVFGDLSA